MFHSIFAALAVLAETYINSASDSTFDYMAPYKYLTNTNSDLGHHKKLTFGSRFRADSAANAHLPPKMMNIVCLPLKNALFSMYRNIIKWCKKLQIFYD